MNRIITPPVFIIFIILSFSTNSFAQLSGTYTIPDNYSSLTNSGGIFEAINTSGLSGNVIILIASNLTSENGTYALNQWTESSGSGYTVTIKPENASVKTISGSVANGLIRLDGADRVTIDGNSGFSEASGTKYLLFRNTNGSYPTFTFLNDARRNMIKDCTIESNNTSTSSGTILFSITSGTYGNDSNIIQECNILNRSDASGMPAYCIFSEGSISTSDKFNSNNVITQNNIYNFLSGGVNLDTGNTTWTITYNHFFQANPLSFTSGDNGSVGINIKSGDGYILSYNYLGGSSSNASGLWSVTCTSAKYYFRGIIINSANSVNTITIQGNIIKNISFNTIPTSGLIHWFNGVSVSGGIVNITDNTIGDTTATSSIIVKCDGGLRTSIVNPIYFNTSSGSIDNNSIGGITVGGTCTKILYFEAIKTTTSVSSAFSIQNNKIGSDLTSNSITVDPANTNTLPVEMNICRLQGSSSAANYTFSNNRIANINNSSTLDTSYTRCLFISTGVLNATQNTFHDISSACSGTGSGESTIPLTCILISSNNSNPTVSQNTIYGLTLTNTNAINTHISGIIFGTSVTSGSSSRNRIYDLTNMSTGAAPSIRGITLTDGGWEISNNQITITNDQPTGNKINISNNSNTHKPNVNLTTNATNGLNIYGILQSSSSASSYYYNSIYIGGQNDGTSLNSYCFNRTSSGSVTFKNNIFINARTNNLGTGYHYAIGNNHSTPTQNWSSSASNYNLLVSSNANTIGEWGSGTSRNIDEWRTSSGGDMQSWSTTSGSLNASNLFTSISSGNLNIQTSNSEAWYVHGKGTPIATISTDYSGNSRSTTTSGGATDIGSNEFSITSTPITATQTGTLGNNQTTTYTFANRTLGSITWGSEGSVPSSVTFLYYSGNNPPNNMQTALYSNAYWSINATGGSGYNYNLTINYDIANQGTINNENNIRIAKSDDGGDNWTAYLTAGTGTGQYSLNTTNKTITIYGLTSFSIFTLTDASSPLPVEITLFTAFVINRDVKLNWETAWEINNSGFEIEKRRFINDKYNEWEKIGFVQGKGTTNEPTSYSYSEQKLSTGKYQYRLKQIDLNGNFEYYELFDPREIIIGKPNAFDLNQNYPNPSNPKSKIDYSLPFDSKVKITFFDITGREIITLVNTSQIAGYYTAEFDGSSLASGIYFYRIVAEGEKQNFTKTKKLVLIK